MSMSTSTSTSMSKTRRLRYAGSVLVFLLLHGARPFAQQPSSAPPSSAPPSSAPPPSVAVQRMEESRKMRTPIYLNDFGELGRYRRANAAVKAPAAGQPRVVFMGDSITDGWRLDAYFPGRGYIDRGIGYQTTPQMLIRFRQDVIALQPQVVVILAGTNDIAGQTGPMSLDDIAANIASMAELARAHGIRVVLSSVLPVHNYTPLSEVSFPLRPLDKIIDLNKRLKSYCAAGGLVYLDYFSAMVDAQGFLQRTLAEDGLHPNKAGYGVMAPLAQAAIQKALAGR